jgi:hypothetical protein
MIKIQGKHWFKTLVHNEAGTSLLDAIQTNKMPNNFLVCLTLKHSDYIQFAYKKPQTEQKRKYKPKSDIHHLFSSFDSYLSFASYTRNLSTDYHSFFEIIFGNAPQKPYFDIDIPLDTTQNIDVIMNEIIGCIAKNVSEFFNKNRLSFSYNKNFIICTSHSDKKRSLHIIIDGYYVNNHEENRIFYEKILEKLPINLKQYIDRNVYSSITTIAYFGF